MTDRPCRRLAHLCGQPTSRPDRLFAFAVWAVALGVGFAFWRLPGVLVVTAAALLLFVLCTAVLLLRGHRTRCATTRGARALVSITDGI
ncbi:hypothetical protein [Streptomyces vilmorinianum]|uniref:hypothetical protein n=1 Tax=Streptomyces vilmorinianum TaxID=3051092 RepID=UPI0010FB7504|nr:hypothetical protein [Streptomyces vilmorinianum]